MSETGYEIVWKIKQNVHTGFAEKCKIRKKVWDFLKNGLDKTTKNHYNYSHQIAKARRCNEKTE